MKHPKSFEDQLTTLRGLFSKSIFGIWISFLLICVVAVFISCDTREIDASAKTELKEEKNMESIQTTTTRQTVIPPIDVAAPIRTKTATFAMG